MLWVEPLQHFGTFLPLEILLFSQSSILLTPFLFQIRSLSMAKSEILLYAHLLRVVIPSRSLSRRESKEEERVGVASSEAGRGVYPGKKSVGLLIADPFHRS